MDDYVESVVLDKIDVGNSDRLLEGDEISHYRGLVGRLNWIAQSARADKSFDVIELSTKLRSPTLSDLKQAIKVLSKVKENKSRIMFPNLPDGISSTMGLVIFLAETGILPLSHGVRIKFVE